MTAQRRLNTLLMTIFAAVAVVIAAVGIYGVVAYSVERRTRELGVRAALGAAAGDTVRLVLVEGLALAGIGLAIGLVAVRGAGARHDLAALRRRRDRSRRVRGVGRRRDRHRGARLRGAGEARGAGRSGGGAARRVERSTASLDGLPFPAGCAASVIPE